MRLVSLLPFSSTASTPEIAKAYRKKSIQLHPDKNPGVKHAHERFARLSVVSSILRNAESRKRYDFFYKNGVPKWRGTGYYYSRFRPGLGTVIVFLVFISSCLQYLVQRMNYNRDLKRIEWIIQQARSAAWGSKMLPIEGRRKVKVNLGGGPRLDEDGNIVSGRMVDITVEGTDVYILEPDGTLLPVNSNTAVAPSFKRTWFVGLMTNLIRGVVKRPSNAEEVNGVDSVERDEGEETDDTSVSGSVRGGTVTPKGAAPGAKGVRAPAVMGGGKRRKNPRRR
ncbi:Uncharacterized J domain-containing protein [Sparassis crispa]|uniref:Uncharacterized J domain-containing protein n=1 Tax=Sparassis crispa TaxID=139825 RepID=A0A401GC37_9APHY|nr:Uncharacterized J domain-containing protein [Sparassis crispa]GBE79720.1 Uncharacterized J domain-containing protein [Sparassis crispa]